MATRDYSDAHEKSVVRALNGRQVPNSGAGRFTKGDVIVPEADMLVECKTVMSEKSSVSVKLDWIEKNQKEAFENRMSNSCVCINFKPGGKNYYVIDEKLMKFLVQKLGEEYD